jgi:hypothetical protein
LVILEILWTLQILLNIAPYERLKPSVSIHVPRLQATGNTEGPTKRPSKPEKKEEEEVSRKFQTRLPIISPPGMMASRQSMMPSSMRLLHDGWECCTILTGEKMDQLETAFVHFCCCLHTHLLCAYLKLNQMKTMAKMQPMMLNVTMDMYSQMLTMRRVCLMMVLSCGTLSPSQMTLFLRLRT